MLGAELLGEPEKVLFKLALQKLRTLKQLDEEILSLI